MARAAHHAAHLAGRFFGSLRPGGPSPAETAWVESQLLDGEVALWRSMSGPDRRHAAGVARRVEVAMGHEVARPVLAAALLHDVGKTVSGLRTGGRVVATLSASVAGRERAIGRLSLYLRHPELGGDLLQQAGSDPLTVAWAREHHLPAQRWTVPALVGEVLKAADDD